MQLEWRFRPFQTESLSTVLNVYEVIVCHYFRLEWMRENTGFYNFPVDISGIFTVVAFHILWNINEKS